MSFRDDDEFDPAIYAVGDGLPGMLWRAIQQQKAANPDPTPNAAQAGAGIVNDSGGLPQQSMIGLFSGKPMRYWGLPIFDTRR
jgi:hypothetical protein